MAFRDDGSGLPYRVKEGELTLQVKAIANAGRSGVVGVRAGELVVRLQVPALEGRANRELVALLSRRLGVARSAVILVSGHTSPHKLLRLSAGAAEALDALCRSAD